MRKEPSDPIIIWLTGVVILVVLVILYLAIVLQYTVNTLFSDTIQNTSSNDIIYVQDFDTILYHTKSHINTKSFKGNKIEKTEGFTNE